LSALNPFKFRQLTRSRARVGAVGFGVLALVCMLLGRVFDDVAWYSSAVLLAILAVVWGLSSALLGKDDPSS
jgi:sugar phosphate permease